MIDKSPLVFPQGDHLVLQEMTKVYLKHFPPKSADILQRIFDNQWIDTYASVNSKLSLLSVASHIQIKICKELFAVICIINCQ
jgi:hypothetical protein